MYTVAMHIQRAKWPSANGKIYESVYLRESYREGNRVKKRNVANLTHCPPEEVAAIELALSHKGDLSVLGSIREIELSEGLSIGAIWAVHQVARRLGIDKALGAGRPGQLALWQVIARVIDQGSRLSAVRLAGLHAAGDVLALTRGFDENDLYANLAWLDERQSLIEKKLFAARRGATPPELFLYDVTSSYLEGERNELAAYGYNRDGKRGKKQIVIGLLCDEAGEPVSVEVFAGNTGDVQTFGAQVRKAAERFGCQRVTFVGDRGMIKSGQVAELSAAGFHYITAITKPQIETLIKTGAIQLGLFDSRVCEVEQDGVRYVLRRNPVRADEMAASRADKLACLKNCAAKKTAHLTEHQRAKVEIAEREVRDKAARLRIDGWAKVVAVEREIRVESDEAALAEASRLDGCYVIKTDLPIEAADAQAVHDRYKDLTQVERAFRTEKTGHLELRPIYVRKAESTRGHVLVVMLAYLIRRELARCWAPFDLTVAEGLEQLKTLCAMEVKIKGGASFLQIPTPREQSQRLLKALNINLPKAFPHRKINVDTRTKLPQRRKAT